MKKIKTISVPKKKGVKYRSGDLVVLNNFESFVVVNGNTYFHFSEGEYKADR